MENKTHTSIALTPWGARGASYSCSAARPSARRDAWSAAVLVCWLCCFCCCFQVANSFIQNLQQQQQQQRTTTTTTSLLLPLQQLLKQKSSSSSKNGFLVLLSASQQRRNNNEDEDYFLSSSSEEEEKERLKLVEQIQKIYDLSISEEETSSLMYDIPLFHAGWTELIGFQKVLTIEEQSSYKQMFKELILRQQQNFNTQRQQSLRYGHVFVQPKSGSSNRDYIGIVGTLMQITDFVVDDDDDDDHLELIVQAIERFEVVNVTTTTTKAPNNNSEKQLLPTPTYDSLVATIRLLPDDEIIIMNDGDNDGKLVISSEFEKWFEWEYYPTKYTDRNIDNNDTQKQGGRQRRNVTPLINYNYIFFADEISIGGRSGDGDVNSGSSSNNDVIELEYKVWVALDELINVLEHATGGTIRIPIPSQLLGLLPLDGQNDWPETFRLDSYAKQLQTQNANVGTYTQTPFVRVAENINYPSIRRSRRFSYVIWILLDSILELFSSSSPSQSSSVATNKQGLLECKSISERLSAAYEQLDQINRILKR